MDNLIGLKDAITGIVKEMGQLKQQLSNVDLKEQDLLHFIEFGKINVRDGYKLAKAIQEIRSERRTIKNRMSQIQTAMAFKAGGQIPAITDSPIYEEHNVQYLKECIDNLAGKGIKIDVL